MKKSRISGWAVLLVLGVLVCDTGAAWAKSRLSVLPDELFAFEDEKSSSDVFLSVVCDLGTSFDSSGEKRVSGELQARDAEETLCVPKNAKIDQGTIVRSLILKGIVFPLQYVSTCEYTLPCQSVVVAEKPEGLSADVYPRGMKGHTRPFAGHILGPQSPMPFILELQGAENLEPGEYKIVLASKFKNVGTSYDTISFKMAPDGDLVLDIFERGHGGLEPELGGDPRKKPGLIASFTENTYYDDSENKITEQSVSQIDAARYAKQGFTADGNTRLMLRATTKYPSTVVFAVNLEGKGAAGFRLESLNRAPAYVDSDGTFILKMVPTLVDEERGIYQATAVLVSPKEFDGSYAYPQHVAPLWVWQIDEDEEYVYDSLVKHKVLLQAPPVVLTHGIYGDNGTFGSDAEMGSTFHILYNNNFLRAPFEFHYDGLRGPSDFMHAEERSLYAFINRALAQYNHTRIACTQVDIVAHSMGGLLVRQFLLENRLHRDSALGYKNGLVRRVITVGTPHQGSNWTSYLVDRKQDLYTDRGEDPGSLTQFFLDQQKELARSLDWFSRKFCGGYFLRIFDDKGKPITALMDLARRSDFINKMQEAAKLPRVPMYSISGNASDQFYNTLSTVAKIKDAVSVGYGLAQGKLTDIVFFLLRFTPRKYQNTPVHGLFRTMFEGKNDLAVDNSSSKWKFPDAYHRLFNDPVSLTDVIPEHHHNAVTKASDVGLHIAELLRGPVSNFINLAEKGTGSSTRALSASSPLKRISDNVLKNTRGLLKASEENDPLERQSIFLRPLQSDARPGDTIVIEAEISSDVTEVDAQPLLFYRQRSDVRTVALVPVGGGKYRAELKVTDESCGTLSFFTFVPDIENSIMYSSNMPSVRVAPDKDLLSGIYFQETPLIITEDSEQKIVLIAISQKGPRKYNISDTALGVIYEVEDGSIATVAEDGTVKAKGVGKTFIRAVYQGLEAVTALYVIRDTAADVPKDTLRPANPVVLSPLSGTTVTLGNAVVLKVSPFDASKGHNFTRSNWTVINEAGQEVAYLDEGAANMAEWHPQAVGAYQWRMNYFYDGGTSETAFTPWATLKVVPSVPVTGVMLSPTSADVLIWKKIQLSALVVPPDATNKDLKWSTSNKAITELDGTGNVFATGIGTATITVTTLDGNYTASCVVTVKDYVSGVTLSAQTITLQEEERMSLVAAVTPESALNKSITWSSSNPSVASITQGGLVTGNVTGTATVTVTTEDGEYRAECRVVVKKSKKYYEKKYPGKNIVIGAPGEEELYGTDEDDVLVSNGDGCRLEGGKGDDIYVYSQSDGDNVISNVSGGEGQRDELHFGPGITKEDLLFDRDGDNLVITVLDERGNEAGSVTVEDWYLADKNKLWKIVFEDGTGLQMSWEEMEKSVGILVEGVRNVRTWRELGSAILDAQSGDVISLTRNIKGPDIFKLDENPYGWGTYFRELPPITANLTLDGNDHTVDAGSGLDMSRTLFSVYGSAGNNIAVTFNNLTLTGTISGGGKASAIEAHDAKVTLDHCLVTRNGLGDSIPPSSGDANSNMEKDYSVRAIALLQNSVSMENGELTIKNSKFCDNKGAGLVQVTNGKLHITDSFFTDNLICSVFGARVFLDAIRIRNCDALIENTVISSNQYKSDSNGIYDLPSAIHAYFVYLDNLRHLQITNTVIFNNGGSAIKIRSENQRDDFYATVTNSTILDNQYGLVGFMESDRVKVEGSILLDNVHGDIALSQSDLPEYLPNAAFLVFSAGDNLIGSTQNGAAFSAVSSDRLGVSVMEVFGTSKPKLADNGGSVPTVAIKEGGLAHNRIPAGTAWLPATDARGVVRPQGSFGDIGAFEILSKDAGPDSGDVKPIAVTGVTLSAGTLTLDEGTSGGLTATVIPGNSTNRTMTWSTSNAAVASVTQGGSVTGHAKGTATVTVTTEDGGYRADCAVTVRKAGGGESSPEQKHYEDKYPDKNVIIAVPGETQLVGTDGNDVLVSNEDDCWLEGGDGDDIYVYNPGSGHDTISNVSGNEGQRDELHFGPGIMKETLIFRRDGNDLMIIILDMEGNESGGVTVEDWYLAEKNKLHKIVFTDGTELTTAQIEALAVMPTRIAKGSAGNDWPSGAPRGERAILFGLDGYDNLSVGEGNDTIIGGPGNDTIQVSGSNHVIVWNRGDGHDTVEQSRSYISYYVPPGILRFGEGIEASEIEVRSSGGYSIVFALKDGSGSVAVPSWYSTDNAKFYAVRFADGTMWTREDIVQLPTVFRGAEGNDTISSNTRAGQKSILYGLGGNDYLVGGPGQDTIVGGPGNDTIKASGGGDIIVWERGDGHDTIENSNYSLYALSPGTLQFGEGIDPSEIEVRSSGEYSLIFALRDDSGSINVSLWHFTDMYKFDEVQFADGTIWTRSDIAQMPITFRGTEGNDTLSSRSRLGQKAIIYGLGGDDYIVGGEGQDTIIGGLGYDVIKASGGGDIVILNRGDGHDRIENLGYAAFAVSPGSLEFGEGITASDVKIQRSGEYDVIVALKDGSASLFVPNWYFTSTYKMSEIRFTDGTAWKFSDGIDVVAFFEGLKK